MNAIGISGGREQKSQVEYGEPMCVNLLERFGKRFKVGFDAAYDPAHRPKDKLDPWYMIVRCERGEIYPLGDDRLAAEVDGRPVTAKKLRTLPGVEVLQVGDDFLAVGFDVGDFPAVAKILRPRRRRQVSESNRQAARERMLDLNRRGPSPARSQAPETQRKGAA